MSLEIRRALADELIPCAQLYERIATKSFHWLEPKLRSAEAMLGAFNNEEVFVALRDHNLVGFLSLYRSDAFVHSLFVEARGEGVGAALLMHAVAEVGGPVSLKCADENVSARRFYDRLGFVAVDQGRDAGHDWTRLRSP